MPKTAWRKRIERWHSGKLVILWSWGGGLAYLAYLVAVDLEPAGGLGLALGFVALAALAAIPVALSAVTWIWLGGRERPSRPDSADESPREPGDS